MFYSGSTSRAEGSHHGHEEKGGLGKGAACAALSVQHVTNCPLPNESQDPIMKGEVIHDIYKDDDTQLDLVWMGSAIAKGSGAFGMDLALLRCCRRIDDQRFAIVSRRSTAPKAFTPPITLCFTLILCHQRRNSRNLCARGVQETGSLAFRLPPGERRAAAHASHVRVAARCWGR